MLYKASLLLTALIDLVGAFFKIQHYPNGGILMQMSVVASLIFMILGLTDVYRNNTFKPSDKLIWTIGFIFLSWMPDSAIFQNTKREIQNKYNPMKTPLLFLFLLSTFVTVGQSRQVCFSFDDLPVVNYGVTDTLFHRQLTDKLVGSLARNHIPAIGFVNEQKMYENGKVSRFQLELLKSWVDNGLDLGNHTYSHPDYNIVSYRDFTADLLKGETLTRKLLQEKGKTLKYFRHPFLHVGPTKAKADSLDAFLKEHHYTVAPVTIDNEDYLFALAYHRAYFQKDTMLMKRIGADFLTYMEAKMKYYEKQSIALFGREIPQIMLLHASLLDSDYVDALVAIYRKNGYGFVNMDRALEDDAFQTPITVYGKWGISWIDKWALSRGKKGEFFREEPLTPEYIHQLSK